MPAEICSAASSWGCRKFVSSVPFLHVPLAQMADGMGATEWRIGKNAPSNFTCGLRPTRRELAS